MQTRRRNQRNRDIKELKQYSGTMQRTLDNTLVGRKRKTNGKIIKLIKPINPRPDFSYYRSEMAKKLNKVALGKKGLKDNKQIQNYIGLTWKNLPDLDKDKYRNLAQRDKERYD